VGIGHQQWSADILAEEFQPTKDVDVPPDNTEIETIARANIAVGGNAVVQSDIDGNMLLNLRWRALECRQCCPRCSQGQLTGWRWIVARNWKDRNDGVADGVRLGCSLRGRERWRSVSRARGACAPKLQTPPWRRISLICTPDWPPSRAARS
jgi:hypothetical protein